MAKINYSISSAEEFFAIISEKLHAIGATRTELARVIEMSEAQLSRLFRATGSQGPTLATIIRIEDGLYKLRAKHAVKEMDRRDDELRV